MVGADLDVMSRDAAAQRKGGPVLFCSLREGPDAAEVAAWVRARVRQHAAR
jgi:urease accessory protein